MLLTNPKKPKFALHSQAISDVTPSHKPALANRPVSSFIPALKPSRFVTSNLRDPDYAARYSELQNAVMTCSLTELKNFYPSEYNSHRSRKGQAKARHKPFAESLNDFRDWLLHLGHKHYEGDTVDRINVDKGYIPKNIRWASKLVQTENRKVTKWHVMPDGTYLTTKRLSEKLKLSYTALYKRFGRGWSIERLLASNEAPPTLAGWKFPEPLAAHCEKLYRENGKHFTQPRIEWFLRYLEEKLNPFGNAPRLEPHESKILDGFHRQARKDRDRILERIQAKADEDHRNLLFLIQPRNDLPQLTPRPLSTQSTAALDL